MNLNRYDSYVGVAGGAKCSEDIYALAKEVGRGLVGIGAIVVCGGRTGVMEGVARGVKLAGGTTIGILPGQHYREANEFIDYPICTGLGQARNLLVVLNSRVLVAIGGEAGTLSEIALALKHNIPVVALHSWPLDKIEAGGDLSLFYTVSDVEGCIEKVSELLNKPN